MANLWTDQDWWCGAVIYPIYPRNYFDFSHAGTTRCLNSSNWCYLFFRDMDLPPYQAFFAELQEKESS